MRLILAIFYIHFSALAFGQESKEPSILSANDNWGKEIINFPIEWAPKLKLKGFEELRFAPYWSNPKSDQFWSLVMAWKVNATYKLSSQIIEDNFDAYFDGLMTPNHWSTNFPKPTVVFLPNPEKNQYYSLIGKMKLFDGFHTGKVISLNITVEQHFCSTTNKAIVIFRMSPKNFEHPIWEELNKIKRQSTSCK